MGIKKMDIEAVTKAIELDAGEALPDLQQALKEAQMGMIGRVTTPEQILVRQARESSGLTQIEFAKRIDTPVATLRDWEQLGTRSFCTPRRRTLPTSINRQTSRTVLRAQRTAISTLADFSRMAHLILSRRQGHGRSDCQLH